MNNETILYRTIALNSILKSPMSEQTSSGEIPPTPSTFGNLLIPVDGLVVDRSGVICFASADMHCLGESPLFPLLGSNISDILASILDLGSRQELLAFLADNITRSFSLRYCSIESTSRSLSITGCPFFCREPDERWLLIIQDVSACQKAHVHLSFLNSERDKIRQIEKKELDEASALLIETNVALRKEVRDRQKTLEKLSISEARFRDLTETTSDFIWEINTAGNYTYASPKSIKLLGLQPQELLGTPLFLLRKVESAHEFIKMIELGGQPQHGFTKIEYSHTRDDGTMVTIESSGEPIFSNRSKLVGFRGIDRDVTERRIYETELKQAKESAELANLAKSEFLANMSHELRTPLHAILSFAKYGEKRIRSASRKELLRFFNQIATSGERLLPLIDSLLDLARLESGKMVYDFQQLDLMTEIKSAVHELTPLAEENSLKITCTPAPIATIAYFDQATIAQVIRNLLANGVKFSNRETAITISFANYEDSEDKNNKQFLMTTISNFGIAIPVNELNTIFDKFAQSSKTKTGAGGTGLGLSICKQIVEDHGGRIWASHGENGDTRFHFTLPIIEEPGETVL
jgi:PAS domain S-box-containing protein